jgi:hypothetical protein
MNPTRLFSLLFVLAALLMAGCSADLEPAQEPAPNATEPTQTPTPPVEPAVEESAAEPLQTASPLFDRVVVMGASATHGFAVTTRIQIDQTVRAQPVHLGDVVQAMLGGEDRSVAAFSSYMFFTRPKPMGTNFARLAAGENPTLIIGVDFLFWFGYGTMPGFPDPEQSAADRLALLDDGLALLDEFDCPIVLGDFPDMSAAVGGMLSASQMPSEASLDALNARLHAWAADRDNIIIYPLEALSEALRTTDGPIVGDCDWSTIEHDGILQSDQLHPTLDGLIAMAQQVVVCLRAHPAHAGAAERVDLDPIRIRDRLQTMLEQQLADSLAPAKPAQP